MALKLHFENDDDIVPLVKFDAKAGRIFRIDRTDGVNSPVDITGTFKAVMDLENIEVGWIDFNTGGAPDFILTLLGSPMPQKPNGDYKQGIRLMLKLNKGCGGDVRELSTTAKAALRGLDALHDAYLAGQKDHPGCLPVVVLKTTNPITTGEGARKTTSYQPVFEITGWTPRPQDLIHKPKKRRTEPKESLNIASPQATGLTPVNPPSATRAEPPMSPASEDDFG
jgi:hypothetical protein